MEKIFKKRFLRIYIPFYLVTIAAYLAKRIMTGGPVFSSDIPKWHIIFTILGIDGYLGEYGIATYSMGIGEWFVGCMIFMYLSFPFLWKAMKRNRNVTMLVATLCYIVITACYAGKIPAHYFFGIKIYAFILGMYFALVLKKPERKYAVFAGTAALILLVLPWKIPMNDDYVLSVFCGLLFLFAFHMEDVRAARNMASGTFIKKLAACSYEMFLIHHWGLILMTKVLKPQVMWKIVAAFILEFIVIYLGATILRMLVKWIEKQAECLEYRCIGRKI